MEWKNQGGIAGYTRDAVGGEWAGWTEFEVEDEKGDEVMEGRAEEKRWNMGEIEKLQGLPWHPGPNAAGMAIQSQVTFRLEMPVTEKRRSGCQIRHCSWKRWPKKKKNIWQWGLRQVVAAANLYSGVTLPTNPSVPSAAPALLNG